ncbi:MAG: hypothetical protein LPK26_08900 [Bacillaceae bacterium]|nr:hypothetical protein [Bacillaceae bacterium]
MEKFSLLIILFILILMGCSSNVNENVTFAGKDVINISLNANSNYEQSQKESFKSNTFKDADSMTIFIEAIKNVERMGGVLNYIAEFNMTVNFKDKSSTEYHISLGNEIEDEGLLVELSNTVQGYIIQKEDAQKLREIIYYRNE